MTSDNSGFSPRECAALKRRLLAALTDAGLGGMVPPSAVSVTEQGVSLNMNINEARWFTNHITDIADGSNTSAPSKASSSISMQDQLALVFEEVHTTPTGYSPARVFAKVAA